ncbi:MAG: glycosyltransferase [Ignavibacteriae bacterium]|nr:glycosyltransferase [Ignavibacteriota bacterium]
MLSVTAVIINYRTPDLTCQAVESFRSFYPDADLLLIDNGSADQSVQLLKRFETATPAHTRFIINSTNLHHGPAMDQAIRASKSELVFFLDSDCIVRGGGFLETMQHILSSQKENYAIGKRIFMNSRGFDIAESPAAIPYIRPYCLMIKRELYVTLPPFNKHGAPCLANMQMAWERRFALHHFPVDEYVEHKGRGTASRHGYHLGLRGKMNHLLNKFGL